MNKTLKVAVVAAVSMMAAANVACSRHKANKADDGVSAVSKTEQEQMTEIFSKIDPSYDLANTTFSSKIEGVELATNTQSQSPLAFDDAETGLVYVKGSILVKGWDAPIGFYSDLVKPEQLTKGEVVNVNLHGNPAKWEETVGGPVTGSVKCLDDKCNKVALYFRIYQGAGYVFNLSEEGYKISMAADSNAKVSMREAVERRGRDARGDN